MEVLNANIKELQDELEKLENGDEEFDDETQPISNDPAQAVTEEIDPEKLQEDLDDTKRHLKTAQDNLELMKKQAAVLANEANRKNNDLQNQLQGVESVMK